MISLRNISKKYKLFSSPKDRLREVFHPRGKKYHKEFWALRDVSLEVPEGQTLGILGRNGSGKSTLLKIIYSVLEPTAGTVDVRGRAAALLELGAGFNPELTGRQNVIMNGVMSGLSKEEMKRRMPVIEDFAEIGGFLDQPVKTYSSGMFVRLAFAASINVDPDVLIIDEALSVGDARFQHKCFNKFRDMQKAGKTILLVSHSTEAITKHCDRAVILEQGRLVAEGAPGDVGAYYVDLLFGARSGAYAAAPVLSEGGYRGFNIVHFEKRYYALAESAGEIDLPDLTADELEGLEKKKACFTGDTLAGVKKKIDSAARETDTGSIFNTLSELERFLSEIPAGDRCQERRSYNPGEYRVGDGRAEIIDYLVASGSEYDPVQVPSGEMVDIYIKVRFNEKIEKPMAGVAVRTVDGILVYGSNTRFLKADVSSGGHGRASIYRCSLELRLAPGDFFLELGVAEKLSTEDRPLDVRKSIAHIRVKEKNTFDGLFDLEGSFEEVEMACLDRGSMRWT